MLSSNKHNETIICGLFQLIYAWMSIDNLGFHATYHHHHSKSYTEYGSKPRDDPQPEGSDGMMVQCYRSTSICHSWADGRAWLHAGSIDSIQRFDWSIDPWRDLVRGKSGCGHVLALIFQFCNFILHPNLYWPHPRVHKTIRLIEWFIVVFGTLNFSPSVDSMDVQRNVQRYFTWDVFGKGCLILGRLSTLKSLLMYEKSF